MGTGTDVLMITYNRARYTRRSLTRLVESADERTRIWIWHNGDHAATLEVAREFAEHPRVHAFHHSEHNERLRVPTNWFWERAEGDLVGKVDDDCLVAPDWIRVLRQAHEQAPEAGLLCCWHFPAADFDPGLAAPKLQTLSPGVRILENFWVAGSGYLMKRACLEANGPLGSSESWTEYGIRLALQGWRNGWIHPFVLQDHLDDPRSPNFELTADEFRANPPLSARALGIDDLEQWDRALRRSARFLQTASIRRRDYRGWRLRATRVRRRIGKLFGRDFRRST